MSKRDKAISKQPSRTRGLAQSRRARPVRRERPAGARAAAGAASSTSLHLGALQHAARVRCAVAYAKHQVSTRQYPCPGLLEIDSVLDPALRV